MAVGGKMGGGAMASLAIDHALNILEELKAIKRELQLSREQEFGKRHFSLQYGGELTAEQTLTLQPTEPIPQGFVFIPERIMAQAQEGSKLKLFRNSVTISNFLEVVTNIQEYSDVVGGLIVEGPSTIIAVIEGTKKTGPVSITVSGQLVPILPSDHSV